MFIYLESVKPRNSNIGFKTLSTMHLPLFLHLFKNYIWSSGGIVAFGFLKLVYFNFFDFSDSEYINKWEILIVTD